MNSSKFFMSIVMPTLNEESNIRAAIERTLSAFDSFSIDGELIVINDGSTDSTSRIVSEKIKGDNRVRVINHKSPQGMGASFWDGVDMARGDIVTMLPGDNENDPSETLCYAGLMDDVDIVIPFAYNKEVRSFFRNFLSDLYRFIINLTFMTSFNHTNSTVICRKSILKQLSHRDSSFFYQTDILIRSAKMGYLFCEVPYRLGLRDTGRSKATSFSSLCQIIKGYIGLVKDVYFKRKRKHEFTADSLTLKRYKGKSEK
ncbi:glycosyltransferase family 2 protein [Candidatus Omnitrophota bacterium]